MHINTQPRLEHKQSYFMYDDDDDDADSSKNNLEKKKMIRIPVGETIQEEQNCKQPLCSPTKITN